MLPIRFKPYIGKDYHKQNFKILTLGESHYFGEKDLNDYKNKANRIQEITNKVVNEYLAYLKTKKGFANWMNTFTKYGNAFVNTLLSGGLLEFWESISFYNYVQAPTSGPRKSPLKEEFESSYQAFEEVVSLLKPDLIILWGDRLWNQFPKKDYKSFFKNGQEVHYLDLIYKVPIFVVKHPSSTAFNRQKIEEIKDYITLVK